MTTATEATDKDFERMTQMLTGFFVTQIAGAVATYSIADHLDNLGIHLAQRDVRLTMVSRAPLAKIEDFKKRMVRKPEAVIESAVKRMLPKNKLAAHMLSKLNVYRGDKHPHQAQKPQDLKLEVREYKARKVAVS